MNTAAPSIVTLEIGGMTCGHCVARVTRALTGVSGVEVKDVTVGGARVTLPGAAAGNAVLAAIQAAGFTARIAPTMPAAKPGGCCGGSPSPKAESDGRSCCG